MTEKQARILSEALKLFAQQGYSATSTSQVAKAAGVSEGLIFRHFNSKEGLLHAILDQGKEMSAQVYAHMLNQSDPKDTLRDILEMPFKIENEGENFWKLIYSLKWQMDTYDEGFIAPIKAVLIDVFQKLGAKDPEAEADFVIIVIDGAALEVLLRKTGDKQRIIKVLLDKYGM